jgi:hypothetical protein
MDNFIQKISLKEWVIIHLCYRDVFNAEVSVDDLATWLGLSVDNKPLHQILDELLAEGLLETDNQGLFCLRGKMRSIFQRPIKQRLTQIMLLKTKHLRLLRFVPFIWYVGISGSVAANNPTMSLEGIEKGKADLDVFVITAPNCFWLFNYFERFFYFLFDRIAGPKHHLFCFNYSLDATSLQIPNKNLYTATEVINLKTVFDRKNTFTNFLENNRWVSRYYHRSKSNPQKSNPSFYTLLYPINFLFYTLFLFSRCLKRRSITSFLEILKPANKKDDVGLYKRGVKGYEEPILMKFAEVFQKYFPSYYRIETVQYLFPEFKGNQHKFEDNEFIEAFRKYA